MMNCTPTEIASGAALRMPSSGTAPPVVKFSYLQFRATPYMIV